MIGQAIKLLDTDFYVDTDFFVDIDFYFDTDFYVDTVIYKIPFLNLYQNQRHTTSYMSLM